MKAELKDIPLREALHFLGWRGTPLDASLLTQIREIRDEALTAVEPRLELRRFPLDRAGMLEGTSFSPQGGDVCRMLAPCREAVLLAATLGAQSERLILRTQAKDAARAVLLDAVLSAAIEAVCDQAEAALRKEITEQGLYLTDRFSPGYGDMPLAQGKEICEVLGVSRRIGLTVSASGIMIPRKSVTAIMGISPEPVTRRPSGCEGCEARENCALRRGAALR